MLYLLRNITRTFYLFAFKKSIACSRISTSKIVKLNRIESNVPTGRLFEVNEIARKRIIGNVKINMLPVLFFSNKVLKLRYLQSVTRNALV